MSMSGSDTVCVMFFEPFTDFERPSLLHLVHRVRSTLSGEVVALDASPLHAFRPRAPLGDFIRSLCAARDGVRSLGGGVVSALVKMQTDGT
ncbi:MAG: hypothetical protein Q9210_000663 [Variospora velana]